MFPTLCDVCYDSDFGPLAKFENGGHYRLSRTMSPSSAVPINFLAPYLFTGPLSSRCSPSPDVFARYSAAEASSRPFATPSASPQRRSKTTIGNYNDGSDKFQTSSSPFGASFMMSSPDERMMPSRSKMQLRLDINRSDDEEESDRWIWIDSLKKWVVEDSENLPYFSFVNTAMLQARASTRFHSTREKTTASVDLWGRYQSKPSAAEPERKKWRARRGFVPPRKPPSKPPTTFVKVRNDGDRKPSKTILRQTLPHGSGDSIPNSRHGKYSASGSHRVHFVDERSFDNESEYSKTPAFDGSGSDHLSRNDSAFGSTNGSRLSLTESEDSGGRTSLLSEGKGVDYENDDDDEAEGRVSTVGSDGKFASNKEDSPDNLSNSPYLSRNSTTLSDRLFDTPVFKESPIDVREYSPPVKVVPLSKSVLKGSTSGNNEGRSRRQKGVVFRRGSAGGGSGDVFGSRDELQAASRADDDKSEDGKGDDSGVDIVPEDSDVSLQVTKEIASVRLDQPPNLELVVDSEKSKGGVAAGSNRPTKPIRRQRPLRNAVRSFPSTPKNVPVFQPKKQVNWLFTDDVTEVPEPQEEEIPAQLDVHTYEPPPLPVIETPPPPRTPSPEEPLRETEIPLLRRRRPPPKPRWGPKRRDQSYMNELKDSERREKARQLVSRMWIKDRARSKGECGVKDAPRFEQYGFLAKYCILNRTSVEMFRRTFDAVDDEQKGWLSYQETLIGLRGVNQKMKDAEEKYLYRVLELCGYNVRRGADFKLFAVLSAMSQKITSLDEWMRNLIGRMDFKMLEMKMFLCKHLWECNVDRDTNKISIEQLCVELRAGGVTEKHIDEVRQRLGWMRALDLLDFLTYIPLFIMLHTSIVNNPLDMSRTK